MNFIHLTDTHVIGGGLLYGQRRFGLRMRTDRSEMTWLP